MQPAKLVSPLECEVWLERLVGDLFLGLTVEGFVVPSWRAKVWGHVCGGFWKWLMPYTGTLITTNVLLLATW